MTNIKRLFFISIILGCFFASEKSNSQSTNRFDRNKKRTGLWKKYYPNKRVRYQGEFKDGKEVGVFRYYDITSSKHPVIVKTFFETSDSVFVRFFTIQGRLQSEGVLYKKKRIGSWQYYFSDGKIISEESYKEGKLHGKSVTYYPNGIVTEVSYYKNGLKHGVSKKYSSNGVLIEEIEYKNSYPNGLAKYFELDGKLKEKGVYKEGRRIGRWEFYLDGEKASEKEVKNSRKTKYISKKE